MKGKGGWDPEGHLGCFQIWALMSKTMHVHEQTISPIDIYCFAITFSQIV